MKWNGMEWNGTEYNTVKSNGIDFCNGMIRRNKTSVCLEGMPVYKFCYYFMTKQLHNQLLFDAFVWPGSVNGSRFVVNGSRFATMSSLLCKSNDRRRSDLAAGPALKRMKSSANLVDRAELIKEVIADHLQELRPTICNAPANVIDQAIQLTVNKTTAIIDAALEEALLKLEKSDSQETLQMEGAEWPELSAEFPCTDGLKMGLNN